MKAFFFILFLFSGFVVSAQNDSLRQLYYKAENEYANGRINEALKILEDNFSKFPSSLKTNVLKLSALCSVMKDDNGKAVRYTTMLLHEYPGYTPLDAPQRFKDLVAELKKGDGTTVTTASAGSETLDEVPVPVTLITEDMIRRSGAQTIQDLLMIYVPGVTKIETNGVMSFVMRGVYGAAQEKALIMINGIRLNSYASNLGLTDFSISLEKIKQIEVLRGPGSSLYGDVALTAVINIITKKGTEIDGFEASVSAGNHGQAHGNLMFGKHYYDTDILVWSSIYRCDGEYSKAETDTNYVSGTYPEKVITGGYNNRPSYDCGANIKYKDFSVRYICNSSKTVIPFTKYVDDRFLPYSYYKYGECGGNKPGTAYTAHNVRTTYQKTFKELSFSAEVTYCRERTAEYFIFADSLTDYTFFSEFEYDFSNLYEDPQIVSKEYYSGLGACNIHENSNLTLTGRLSYNYGSIRCGGSIQAGYTQSLFKMIHQKEVLIHDYTEKYTSISYPVGLFDFDDRERKSAAFVQIKHRQGRFILNSGIRYDRKERCMADNSETRYTKASEEELDSLNRGALMNEFSPRISVIYTADRLNLKLNYSKSFVDAPYTSRIDQVYIFLFGKNLNPERLNSFQFTATGKNFVRNLTSEINLFYNSGKGLIMPEGKLLYINWDLNMAGIEAVVSYENGGFSLYADATFQKIASFKPFKQEVYENVLEYSMAYGSDVYNTPAFFANAVLSYRFNRTIRANLGLNYCGRQYFDFKYTDENYETIHEARKISQYFLVNPGLNFDFGKLKLDINIHNVFNHKYSLGGNCFREIPQKGLWLMAGASYSF